MSREPGANAALELRDSTLEAIEQRDDDLVVVLTAYVHRSDGRPGIDAGSVWLQPLELRFARATASGSPDDLPMDIFDGRMILGETAHGSVVPLPMAFAGPCRIECEPRGDGEPIVVEGAGVTAQPTGKAKWIEALQGEAENVAPSPGE